MTSRFAILLLATLLPACRTVDDAQYLKAEYQQSEGVEVATDTADGPLSLIVRLHPTANKVMVGLNTDAAMKRALAKDFSGANNALPQKAFEDAANKRLIEARGPGCATQAGTRRQDYLWEFDYACRSPADRARKQTTK